MRWSKKDPELAKLMKDASKGDPYVGAKQHYILDTEDRPLTEAVTKTPVRIAPVRMFFIK